MNLFTISGFPEEPPQRVVDFVLANYWVRPWNSGLRWSFGQKPGPVGARPARRPTLEEIAAARWDGERRSSSFRVRPGTSGAADRHCPVYQARQAARDYLKRKGSPEP